MAVERSVQNRSAAVQGRVFVALWPHEGIARQIALAAATLVGRAGGRPVHPRDLHLTLAFLGPLSPARLEDAIGAVSTIAHPAIEIPLGRFGCFRRAGVLWLAPRARPVGLVELHSVVSARLLEAGFAAERRPFKPHITLARRNRPIRSQQLEPPIEWRAETLVVATSIPGASEPPRYRHLETIELGRRH